MKTGPQSHWRVMNTHRVVLDREKEREMSERQYKESKIYQSKGKLFMCGMVQSNSYDWIGAINLNRIAVHMQTHSIRLSRMINARKSILHTQLLSSSLITLTHTYTSHEHTNAHEFNHLSTIQTHTSTHTHLQIHVILQLL